MTRSWAIAAGGGTILFATTDLTLNALTVWLAQHDLNATSAVANELLLRVLPLALAGLVAGYVASPNGFSAAACAGLAGAAVSLAIRYRGTAGWAAPGFFNAAAMLGWMAGNSILSGICGWAGERLRTKGGRANVPGAQS